MALLFKLETDRDVPPYRNDFVIYKIGFTSVT